MRRRVCPRNCVRLDGVSKVAYAARGAARHGRPKHEAVYCCRYCGAWIALRRQVRNNVAPRSPCGWVVWRAAQLPAERSNAFGSFWPERQPAEA